MRESPSKRYSNAIRLDKDTILKSIHLAEDKKGLTLAKGYGIVHWRFIDLINLLCELMIPLQMIKEYPILINLLCELMIPLQMIKEYLV